MTTPWSSEGWGSASAVGGSPSVTPPAITFARTVSANTATWNVSNGGTTMSNNLAFFGTSSYASSQIDVYRDGILQGSATTDVTGAWTYPIGYLPSDGLLQMTATVTNGGLTSNPSNAFNITIAPGITGVTIGVNIPDNNAGTMFNVGGEPQFFAESDEDAPLNPTPLIASTTHQLDFDLQPSDSTGSDNSNRSEITAGFSKYPDGTTFNITYEMLLNAADPMNNAGISIANGGLGGSTCCGQLHDESTGTPLFKFFLGDSNYTDRGDILAVSACTSANTPAYPYIGTTNLARGVWHRFELSLRPAASGAFARGWLNNVQIFNQTTFRAVSPYRIAFGFYRNPPAQTQRQRLSYRNFMIRYD